MLRKCLFLIIIFLLFNTKIVLGARGVHITCKNKECNYSKGLIFGSTMLTGKIEGYCTNCDDFVCIEWTTEKQMPDGSYETFNAPEPIARIWDFNSAEPRSIYPCPKCGKGFVEIQDIENLKYCPKCKQPTLSVEKTGLYVD